MLQLCQRSIQGLYEHWEVSVRDAIPYDQDIRHRFAHWHRRKIWLACRVCACSAAAAAAAPEAILTVRWNVRWVLEVTRSCGLCLQLARPAYRTRCLRQSFVPGARRGAARRGGGSCVLSLAHPLTGGWITDESLVICLHHNSMPFDRPRRLRAALRTARDAVLVDDRRRRGAEGHARIEVAACRDHNR